MSETPAAPDSAAPPARAGSPTRRSVADMVRTLVVIIGVVTVLVLIVPRPNEVTQPDVDAAAAARSARIVVGFEPAVPVGLPSGWAARTASAQVGTDDVTMWSVQYRTPAGDYGTVRQARDATPRWEARQVTDGREAGTVTIAGRPWVVRSRTDRGITSWVLRAGDLTTIVTGTASAAELETLASHLPADTLAPALTVTLTPMPSRSD